ncbi:hypothetical protein [Actinoplanes sp. URMC 104]|uniref:hypothetical protein n=1 Tax=Actinoplanes sp. URMC 104 TaxID=3423409 RepID=UPI003F1CF49D
MRLTIPDRIDGCDIVAWLPIPTDFAVFVAVAYTDDEYREHAPYIVWRVCQVKGAWVVVDGVADIEDLGAALIEATAVALATGV